jgi:glyoxylase-like metal-dependent hydrolase (beta-lactamase superfamily II)
MELFPVETGNLKLDGGAMFGVVPKVLWSKAYPVDENNLINLSMRCLLIVQDNKVILIDDGIGNKQHEKFFSLYHLNGDDNLEKSLKDIGFTFNDITDVILTHLHFDHAGGSITYNADHTALTTTFPSATYWVSQQQWNWANEPNPREKSSFLKENILPLKESHQLKFIDHEEELFPGITLKLFNGHTDGQIIPHIRYKDKTIVYCADLLPTSSHVPLPYVMSYDIRPLVTFTEKAGFLKEAADNDYILFLEHDIRHQCCLVESVEKNVRTASTFDLSEVL